MTVNFLNRCFFSIAFIFAIMGAVRLNGGDPSNYRRGIWLLWVWSAGAFLLALFATEVPSRPISWHGAIHLVVAVVAFPAGAFGALSIAVGMGKDRTFQRVYGLSLALGILAVILCLLVLFGPTIAPRIDSDHGGLSERLFLGAVLLWMAAISIFYLISGQKEKDRA